MKSDTIYARFSRLAAQHPDATAIVGTEGRARVSYAGLSRMADAVLARFPSGAAGCGAVGIVMSHGPAMIAAMLAVLKSGAAYVPAEPSLPRERIDYMMADAGAAFVIDDDFCRGLEADPPSAPDMSRPDGAAYVLYTSGTTGRPKGVMVENHSVVNYAEAFEAEFHTGPGDVMLQCSVCSFDIFVEEVFATLLNGAALAIAPADVRSGPAAGLMDFVRRHGVTQISGFPYLLAEINRLPGPLPRSLRLLISGGDVLRANYIDRLKDSGVAIYNTYGPSETTVCASYCRCDDIDPLPDGTYPVGRPVKGVRIRLLDEKLRPVRKGRVGEICIYGEGVARGYVGNPPESVNFATTPRGERFYRSGDLGAVLPDGNIAFLHRRDEQVMILGRRVEPEEVENVLNSSPDVERGVVAHYADSKGLAYLVAYFVPRKASFSLKAIRAWLASRLTDYMIPEFFVAMKSIPLTPRGKTDRAALPVVLKDNEL